MQILCLFSLFFVAFFTKAQTFTHWPQADFSGVDSTTLVDYRQVFYTQTERPFYTWDVQPKNFEFYLFDRWGNILAQTEDPNFVIDKILKRKLPEDTYIARLTFTDLKGENHKIVLHYDYLGFYCGG